MKREAKRASMLSKPQHPERHLSSTATLRDVVIGMSDGLTVPFALAAGIAGALAASHIVVTAGVAELAAGGISMGLGGYLATRTDRDHYENELAREYYEAEHLPETERAEVAEVLSHYGLSEDLLKQTVDTICSDRERWVEFMMRFELGLERPEKHRAILSGVTIGLSYVVGGVIPLAPYALIAASNEAFLVSALLTGIALALFGAVKGRLTGIAPWLAALQTLAIGGVASGVAFLFARWVAGG